MILPLRLLRMDLEKLHTFLPMLHSRQCDYGKKYSFHVTTKWTMLQ